MLDSSDSHVSAKVIFDYPQPYVIFRFVTYYGRLNSKMAPKIAGPLMHTPYNSLHLSVHRTGKWDGTDAALIR